jgi:alpha-1,2-mannosyltransferase
LPNFRKSTLACRRFWDLCQRGTPASRDWKGIAAGIAAGVKLVPLIFIPYLLLIRKFRQAALAIAGFAGTVMLGFLILPGDSRDWWFGGLFFQDGRTGFVGWGGNQSLPGILTRVEGSINAATVPWVAAVAVVTAGGLLAAAMLHRSGHAMLGLLMTSLVVFVILGLVALTSRASAKTAGEPVADPADLVGSPIHL